jgi:hypothetical protein
MKIRGALLLLLVSGSAVAGERVITLDRTCVEIDATVDSLVPADREHATQLITRVLERQDLLVVASDCTETFTLSHEHAGEQFVIRMSNSAGKRRLTTPALDELSAKYERMVRSLIEAKQAAQAEAARPAVAPAQIAPEPQVAVAEPAQEPLPTALPTATIDAEPPPELDPTSRKASLWYLLIGAQLTGGAAGSLGYRYRRDTMAVDIALGFRESDEASRGTAFGGKLLRMSQATPTTTLYAGGGLSFGVIERGSAYSSEHYTGAGVHGDLAAGLQMGRARGAQFVAQLEVVLPFYRLSNDEGSKDYSAGAMLTAGVGW